MADKTFKLTTLKRTALARSERLRKLGATVTGGSVTINNNGSGSTSSGDGHTHSNKSALDSLSIDDARYLYIALLEQVTDDDGTTSWATVVDKVKAGYADEAGDLSDDSPVWDELLSSVHDDTAEGVITFLAGMLVGTFVTGESGAQIDKNGNAEVETLYARNNVKAKSVEATTVKATDIDTETLDADEATVKNLTVTGKATFFELVIDKVKAVGGAMLVTPADGFDVETVEYDEDNNAYKLSWKATDGEKAITNMWEVGDQAICQTFNAAEGTTYNASNKLWWSLVTEVGTYDDADGTRWNYIIVDFDDVSDNTGDSIPEVGDAVAMLGNRTDTDRMSATYISAYSSLDSNLKAPLIASYKGVNNYDLSSHCFFKSDANGVMVKGELINITDDTEYPQMIYVGDWAEGTTYNYYEEVSYNGGLYLCMSLDGCTGVTPGSDTAVWKCLVSPSSQEEDPVRLAIYVGGSELNYMELAYGETLDIECVVMQGWKEYSEEPDTWTIVRDSGDEANDAAWLLKDKVKNFAGTITLSYTPDENDLAEDTSKVSTTFTITASKDDETLAAAEITI